VRAPRAAAIAAAVLLVVGGCTREPRPEPTPGAVPSQAASGAVLVCGVDESSLAAVTGERAGGPVAGPSLDGDACSVPMPEDAPLAGQALLITVSVLPVDSPDGATELERIDGTRDRAPDVRYDGVHGAAWLDDAAREHRFSAVSGSSVVWGDHVVKVTIGSGAAGRDIAADLLALSSQVAHSVGLD
jgi:hypothetical protein